jgi:signal transduction histidine kinase
MTSSNDPKQPTQPFFRPRSLRTRLILLNSLTLAALLGAIGLILPTIVRTGMMASIDRDLAAQAEQVVRNPPPPGRRPGPPPDQQPFPGEDGAGGPPEGPRSDQEPGGADQFQGSPPSGAIQEEPKYHPRVLDMAGRTRYRKIAEGPWDQKGFELAARGETHYSTLNLDGEPVRLLSVPRRDQGGHIVDVIQVPYQLQEMNRAVAGVNRAMFVLIPIALIFAWLGGAMLTNRALRPVQQIAHTAEQIGAQDLSQRLKVDGEDEFAQLAVTFNAMLSRLEFAFEEQQGLIVRLQEFIETQKRFTADASHELRTPLTIIKANTSLALSGTPTVEDYQQSIQEIDGAAGSMSHLVQDLLLLARADDGQLGRGRIVLPLQEILKRAVSNVSHRKGATITSTSPEEPLSVQGNEEELVRLFTNLLENALLYTPANGHIRVTSLRVGDSAFIEVADTGVGIAPEHLAHLGERFYRVSQSRARPDGGSGLGLSICKGIVAAHRGSITFESKEGEGTKVSVSLPLAGNKQSSPETTTF